MLPSGETRTVEADTVDDAIGALDLHLTVEEMATSRSPASCAGSLTSDRGVAAIVPRVEEMPECEWDRFRALPQRFGYAKSSAVCAMRPMTGTSKGQRSSQPPQAMHSSAW